MRNVAVIGMGHVGATVAFTLFTHGIVDNLYLLDKNQAKAEAEEDVKAGRKPKPQAVLEKMVNGRVEKFYKENCLMEQVFIKDGDKTITDVITEKIAKIGENINVRRFVRYALGEGIEKRQDDFEAEVRAAAGQ